MKDWLVARVSEQEYWLTRIEILPNGRQDYLCGSCGGPLEDHVVAFFASTNGAPGTVACSICQNCHQLLQDKLPVSDLDAQIELLLAAGVKT